MYQAGLVLEGGGMKGLYTAAILDYFLEKELSFANCYGVSAGAIHLCNFLSKQKGRGKRIGERFGDDKRYCSIYSLLTTGDLFGAKFCYETIPNELEPYDHETFFKYKGNAYAVLTNIITGEPYYYPLKDLKKDIIGVRASSSLPIVSKNVWIDGVPYLDGGMSDSIPIQKSIEDGNEKHIVILTKEEGYIRKPSSQTKYIKLMYRKYPKLYENMAKRHITYNETIEFLEEQQRLGKVFVIRPKVDLGIKRIEKDAAKLEALYQQGYEDAKNVYEDMIAFLEQK